jgi:hypothetical protein
LVNHRSICNFFSLNQGMGVFKACNNIFAGNGNLFSGNPPLNPDTASNAISADMSVFAFENAGDYDYQLTSLSSHVINRGVNPGYAGALSLMPSMIYHHPQQSGIRCANGMIDIGAYEYCGNTGLTERVTGQGLTLELCPNPVADNLSVSISTEKPALVQITISNLAGFVVFRQTFSCHSGLNTFRIGADHLSPGSYVLHCASTDDQQTAVFTKI